MSGIKKAMAAMLVGIFLFCMAPATVFASEGTLNHATTTFATKARAKAKSKKRVVTGTFRDTSGEHHVRYTPYVKFNKNGTFLLHVNLYEGMGTIKGTYKRSGSNITCKVKKRDFSGVRGDRVNSFRFTVKDGKNLVYRGGRIGTTCSGFKFRCR